MRDVRNFKSDPTRIFNRTVNEGCENPDSRTYGPTKSSTSSGRRQITRSQRSDVTPTRPSKNGQYYRSTAYSACFVTTTSSAGWCHIRNPESWARSCENPPGTPRSKKYNEYWWETSTDWGAWNIGLSSGLNPKIPLAVIAEARSKLLGQLSTQDFDAGVFAGELKETVRGVADILKDAAKLVRAIRRPLKALQTVRLADVRRSHNRAAGEYLRFMYGIRPIMNDIHALSQNMSDGFFNKPVGFAQSTALDKTFKPEFYGTSSFPKVSNVDIIDGSWKRGVEMGASYSIASPTRYQLQNYGVVNPLAVAWELTTLSFVIDWFTGIGAFLGGLTAGFGLNHTSGYETHFQKVSGALLHKMAASSGLEVFRGDTYMTCGLNQTAMRRFPVLGFLPPPIYLKVDLNLSQVLSSLALTITALRR